MFVSLGIDVSQHEITFRSRHQVDVINSRDLERLNHSWETRNPLATRHFTTGLHYRRVNFYDSVGERMSVQEHGVHRVDLLSEGHYRLFGTDDPVPGFLKEF